MASYNTVLNPYTIGSKLGAEPDALGGKQPDGLPYIYTWRHLPPNEKKWWFHSLQKGVSELVLTFIFIFAVITVKAGGADPLTYALVVGALVGGLFYSFYNWNKPYGNPWLSITFAICGHDNVYAFLLSLLGQLIGAFIAIGVAWAFIPIDGGVVPPVVTSTLTVAKIVMWECLVTFIICSVSVWSMDRIFAELREIEDRARNKKTDGGKEFMEGSDAPIGLFKAMYSHMAGRVSVALSVLFFTFFVAGYLFNGAPCYNLWIWVAHVTVGTAPGVGVLTIGQQFCAYFLGPAAGAVFAGVVMNVVTMWTRNVFANKDEKCDKGQSGLWPFSRY